MIMLAYLTLATLLKKVAKTSTILTVAGHCCKHFAWIFSINFTNVNAAYGLYTLARSIAKPSVTVTKTVLTLRLYY